MKSTFYSGQQVLAWPVSYYMVVAQLKGHGLVDIGVVIQGRDDSELGTREKTKRSHY